MHSKIAPTIKSLSNKNAKSAPFLTTWQPKTKNFSAHVIQRLGLKGPTLLPTAGLPTVVSQSTAGIAISAGYNVSMMTSSRIG